MVRKFVKSNKTTKDGPTHVKLVVISLAIREDSGEPEHLRSLTRAFADRRYKVCA